MSNDKKIGNAAVDNVIKIPIPDLQSAQETDTSPAGHLYGYSFFSLPVSTLA